MTVREGGVTIREGGGRPPRNEGGVTGREGDVHVCVRARAFGTHFLAAPVAALAPAYMVTLA